MKDILRIITRLSPIIVFGERGTGKTSLLINLANIFLNYKYYLFLNVNHSDFDYFEQQFLRAQNKIFIDKHTLSTETDLKSLIQQWIPIIKKILLQNKKAIIVIDNLSWIPYLSESDIRSLISRITDMLVSITTICKIFGTQFIFIMSAPEDIKTGLPFGWRGFIGYGFNLLRVERLSRIRKLAHIQIETRRNIYSKKATELFFFLLSDNKKISFSKIHKEFLE